jgi:exodeoxyribonuclease VII large subunit
LQGDGAVESIRKQLLDIKKKQLQFDAVLIIRGGGDEIGMACYDHYSLASEVARFPLPVISGIGHSTNETVVEMVSNINKITPTDVAHYLIGCFQTFDQRIQNALQMLQLAGKVILDTSQNHFNQVSNHFAVASQTFVNQEKQSLGQTALIIRDSVNSAVFNHRMALGRFENILQATPSSALQQHKLTILQHQKLLLLHQNLLLKKNNILLENLEHKIKILDPKSVLKRGFTITRHEGKTIPPGFVPEDGLAIETEHFNGKFKSIITKK